jgi:2-polyprenyl-3-methyl-5-hydroxy-6-metoxy-1,4-benzoquinol methylase
MNVSLKKQNITAYEEAYSASDFEVLQAKYRKKLLLELLEKTTPKRLLEIGCGWDTIGNSWQGYTHLTIIEPGSQFANKALLDTANQGNVSVIEAFLEEAGSQLNGQFDLILLSSLLHEVEDPSAILKCVKAVCGPETLVHINVPNAKSMHRLLALEMGLIQSVSEQSVLQQTFKQPRIFDLESLKTLADETGFEVVSKGSYFMKPFTHAQMHTLCQTGFIETAMLDGLWALTRHFPENGSEIYMNMRCKENK